MKRLTYVILAAATMVIAVYVGFAKSNNATSHVTISEIEAIAACEVSSDGSENGGYCTKMVGGGGDVCVELGAPQSVRCNGNL